MIEPTREFYYSFLTMQKKLGVKYTQADLEQVSKLFLQREYFASNKARLTEIEQEFYALMDF
jgi:hypothetical protein